MLSAPVLLQAVRRLQNLPGLPSSQETPEHLALTPANEKNARLLQNVKAGKRRDGLESRPFTGQETDTRSQTQNLTP